MWHRVAPMLAQKFSLILADLPGYGWSAAPHEGEGHSPYHKRAMANAMIDVMEALGHVRFRLAGHDRGGRVAYRLALDHPGRVEKLATLDIVPTLDVWRGMDAKGALSAWHWPFLAQSAPLPELLLGKAANEYFDLRYNRASAGGLAPDPRALEHYRASFTDPARIHAQCEDYRAGATIDVAHDEADRAAGRKITCPLLVLWGARGGFARNLSPLETWKNWATNVSGHALDCGHYLAEEKPEETAKALLEFF
jgi:haloacetate dehalogenase